MHELREQVFAALQRLSVSYYESRSTGEIMSRVTNDTGLIQQGIANVIEDLVKEPCTLVGVLGWLFYTDWKLTLASLVIFPACVVPIIVLGKRTRKASKNAQQNQADLLAVLQEAEQPSVSSIEATSN